MSDVERFDERFVVDVQPHPRPATMAVMKPDQPVLDDDIRTFLDGEELKFASPYTDNDSPFPRQIRNLL